MNGYGPSKNQDCGNETLYRLIVQFAVLFSILLIQVSAFQRRQLLIEVMLETASSQGCLSTFISRFKYFKVNHSKLVIHLLLIFTFQQKYTMILGKEDELLEKLQKCVGRLDSKPAQYTLESRDRSFRGLEGRSSIRPTDQQRASTYVADRLNKRVHNYQQPPLRHANSKWIEAEDRHDIEPTKYKSTNYQSNSKQYLTDRVSYEIPQREQQIKQKYSCNRPIPDENAGRSSSYMKSQQKQRRPLRQYEMNVSINSGSKDSALISLNKRANYGIGDQNSASKFNSTMMLLQPNKDLNRRKSLQYSESYNFKAPRTKEYTLDTKINQKDLTHYVRQQKTNFDNENRRPSVSFSTKEKAEQFDINAYALRSRELSTSRNQRQIGIGSISSVNKRNSIDVSRTKQKNFETFQSKDVKELNLKQILDEVGNNNQDTFAKLQKINQLNERINSRIKNIISTFETK